MIQRKVDEVLEKKELDKVEGDIFENRISNYTL